jgi:hypothetical protein
MALRGGFGRPVSFWSMIPKSGRRFSEKIMRKQKTAP